MFYYKKKYLNINMNITKIPGGGFPPLQKNEDIIKKKVNNKERFISSTIKSNISIKQILTNIRNKESNNNKVFLDIVDSL